MSKEQTITPAAKADWENPVTEGHVWHARITIRAMPARWMTFAALVVLSAV